MTAETSDNLSAGINLRELASSAHFALKLFFLLLTAAFSFMLDLQTLGLACVFLGSASLLIERRLSVRDPASTILLLSGLALCLLQWLPTVQSALPANFLPALPFVAVFTFYLGYSLLRQPFAELFAQISSLPALRRQHTQLWLIQSAAIAALWLLLPAHYFAPLAAVIAVEALILHGYLQLVGVGSFWQGAATRELEEFRFVRVEKEYAQLKPLYDLFIKELTPALKEGDRLHDKSHDEIVQMKMQSDQKKWKYATFYAAYHGEKLVGTVTCQFDSNERKVPVEYITSKPMNLDKLREYGPVVELGRLSVAEDYRMAPEVLAGLIMCATETALAHDTCFIVLQAVEKTARIYSKMGFAPILEESVTNLEYGTPMKLFALNLAAQSGTRNPYRDNMAHHFSPYIVHRFVWRQIVKTLLRGRSRQKRISDLSTQELPALAQFT